MASYGRNRQSIADIEETLNDIFHKHPQSHLDQAGQPSLPADNLPDISRTFSESYHGLELMTNEELEMLKMFLSTNPGLEVTPQMLLQFIAQRTTHSPQASPHTSPTAEETNLEERGRGVERDDYGVQSRSSSRDSVGTSVYRPGSRQSSVGPPVPPKTPISRTGPSPFDTSKRQRSQPLEASAPSSWAKRPTPAYRRKSDAGSAHNRALSDTESMSGSPSAYGITPRRPRAPSNPTSPQTYPQSLSEPSLTSPDGTLIGSPPWSKQHSRATSVGYYYSHTADRHSPPSMSPPHVDPANPMYDYRDHEGDFSNPMSPPAMPHSSEDESEDESALGLVLDRSATSSTVSLDVYERVDAFQRSNADLAKKLMEAERSLQHKISEHESELEEMQARIDELRSELSATKKEEKELRAKERMMSNQLSVSETEIARCHKLLDNSRTTYQNLQKQYQEQCAESERYRNTLRRRDQEIKDYQDAGALQTLETSKWAKEQAEFEDRIARLEDDLSIAQQAHAQLDEQKQENLLLKETIDRMRFEMDEMRVAATSSVSNNPGGSSAPSSISRSLGAELMGKMKGMNWDMDEDELIEEGSSGDTIGELEIEDDGVETEGEDVIETIITRKKRKVLGRANKIETHTVEEIREYSDAYTQYDRSEFTASFTVQTDEEPKPATASFSVQTDEPAIDNFAVQTDPEPVPPRVTLDGEAQTEELEAESPRSSSPQPTPEEDEAMASSSSTVLPPTPKAKSPAPELHPSDSPPAYTPNTPTDPARDALRIAAETLKQWHGGVDVSDLEPVPGGISDEALEEWRALKEELGIECKVIDKVLASSERRSRPSKDGKAPVRKGRFFNIYNTYIYGGKDGDSSTSFPSTPTTHLLLCIGASAAVMLAMSNMMPQQSVPGGPTYYDRAAWNSFNEMRLGGEGFVHGGSTSMWNFLGQVGGGAVRIVRGWPT